jgi:multidrug efflux pump
VNISAPFIARPVATILLSIGLFLTGAVAYRFLPVAALPSIDVPYIVVIAGRPGADPETMANSVAAPLERRLGEIAGVTEITSTSSIGNTSVVLQFDISRDINGAAHDVQAAINAATTDLPADLPVRPYYRKFNPADAPIMTIALSSTTATTAQIYDAADSVLAQRLSQVEGVAQVTVNGAEKPAVRIALDPVLLAAAGLSGQDVYNAVRGANTIGPLGGFQGDHRAEGLALNSQIAQAAEYRPLIVKTANGAILRLSDVANVTNGVANARLAAWNGKQPAILLTITKEAGANVIETADRIQELLPRLMRWLPSDIAVTVIGDRTTTIRASIADVQWTLLIAIGLVLMVVLLFMRRLVPTVAAAVTVPLSLSGTLAAMWAMGYTIDNFSLMALTISVGFVVDDAIVMIENIVRHMEQGETPLRAALNGSRQIGFTVVSISLSLVAVFIPLIFMGGIQGRLFHEFAMTMTMAIGISAVVSLTLTPMICGRYMRHPAPNAAHGRFWRGVDWALTGSLRFYARTLGWALAHPIFMIELVVFSAVAMGKVFALVPGGFMPLQDTGMLIGSTLADPDISFRTMETRQRAVVDAVLSDPAVASVASNVGVSAGWSSLNRGSLSVNLKPLKERGVTSEAVIARLRPKLTKLEGVQTFLFSAQDLRGGGRQGGSQFQYALISQDLALLRVWSQKLEDKLKESPELADVTSDQDRAGPQVNVVIDREAAARLGVSTIAIDTALNNAYAQRQVSTIYAQRNQYKVVLEIDPALQTDPSLLSRIYVGSAKGQQIPLSALARFERATAPLAVRHQGQFPAATISFNLAPGVAQGVAQDAVEQAARELRMPESVKGEFAGSARWQQQSLTSNLLLIGAALLSIYIVLGVLYESLIHPITIMLTLPPALLGAALSLWIFGFDLSVISIIGIILLIGIVKKNAIMMIDFALEAEREQGMTPFEAIHAACLARFRPITMTTMAALFGALPLAMAFGTGSELRQPLGYTIAGGLIVSQMLTLYTTPVIYLMFERFAAWLGGRRRSVALPSIDGVTRPAE